MVKSKWWKFAFYFLFRSNDQLRLQPHHYQKSTQGCSTKWVEVCVGLKSSCVRYKKNNKISFFSWSVVSVPQGCSKLPSTRQFLGTGVVGLYLCSLEIFWDYEVWVLQETLICSCMFNWNHWCIDRGEAGHRVHGSLLYPSQERREQRSQRRSLLPADLLQFGCPLNKWWYSIEGCSESSVTDQSHPKMK